MKVKVRDRVAIVQGPADGVHPSLIGLQATVTRIYSSSKYIPRQVEVTFVDEAKRVFYEDELEKLPAD